MSFFALQPQNILEAAEAAGFHPTGEFTQLNSYENRVFDLKLENTDKRIIAKFYRPGRWNEAALQEEHQFLIDLQNEGLTAVPPLFLNNKKTVMKHESMFVSFFPKVLGRMPQEFLGDELKQVGRLLAHLHNVGSQKKFKHRPVIGQTLFSPWENLEEVASRVVPELWKRYEDACVKLIEAAEDQLDTSSYIRIHGDCHKGNLLHNGKEFFFVDFDDCATGPAAQDFWMLLSDDPKEKEQIISGYEELREFPDHEWELIPVLRGLRILSYAAWIARRWEDPSFPRLFPEYGNYTYWAEETEALEKIVWNL